MSAALAFALEVAIWHLPRVDAAILLLRGGVAVVLRRVLVSECLLLECVGQLLWCGL